VRTADFEDGDRTSRTRTAGHTTPSAPDYEAIGAFYCETHTSLVLLVERHPRLGSSRWLSPRTQ
jgi:hypothetical protein